MTGILLLCVVVFVGGIVLHLAGLAMIARAGQLKRDLLREEAEQAHAARWADTP